MASLTITVTGNNKPKPLLHETFELSPELAQEFIIKLEAMLVELPGQPGVIRTRTEPGLTVFEVELRRPGPEVKPTFQELFRRPGSVEPKEAIADVEKTA
jgi:hypothetical protein